MRWLPFALPLMLALAFLLGWTYPGRPEEPLGVVRGGSAARALVLRPGESAAEAMRFLRTLRSDPPPPPPPPPPAPPPPPPPPPDIAVVFRGMLRGVEQDERSGGFRALVDTGGGVSAVGVGHRLERGWRITKISADRVTLGKGRESRVVRLYG